MADWAHRFRDEEDETMTKCPACNASGKAFIEEISTPATPGLYRFALCHVCKGKGIITASKASRFRLKALHLDD